MAGYAFPAHLFVGAGHETVPVARGDLGVAAVEWSPDAGLLISAQAFARAMHGVVQVAGSEPGPFSQGAFSSGSGSARGLSVLASSSSARYGLLVSYGWQRVRYRDGGSSYSPAHGTEHLLDAGLVVHTTGTSLIRASASAGFGRNASPSAGPFEWEACNLSDGGCEFFGAPLLSGELEGQELPAYLRVDIGARKHWHLEVGGRDASIVLYGTVTNMFGRSNVLAEIVDPLTNELRRIGMRPRSPLVIGLDWRF